MVVKKLKGKKLESILSESYSGDVSSLSKEERIARAIRQNGSLMTELLLVDDNSIKGKRREIKLSHSRGNLDYTIIDPESGSKLSESSMKISPADFKRVFDAKEVYITHTLGGEILGFTGVVGKLKKKGVYVAAIKNEEKTEEPKEPRLHLDKLHIKGLYSKEDFSSILQVSKNKVTRFINEHPRYFKPVEMDGEELYQVHQKNAKGIIGLADPSIRKDIAGMGISLSDVDIEETSEAEEISVLPLKKDVMMQDITRITGLTSVEVRGRMKANPDAYEITGGGRRFRKYNLLSQEFIDELMQKEKPSHADEIQDAHSSQEKVNLSSREHLGVVKIGGLYSMNDLSEITKKTSVVFFVLKRDHPEMFVFDHKEGKAMLYRMNLALAEEVIKRVPKEIRKSVLGEGTESLLEKYVQEPMGSLPEQNFTTPLQISAVAGEKNEFKFEELLSISKDTKRQLKKKLKRLGSHVTVLNSSEEKTYLLDSVAMAEFRYQPGQPAHANHKIPKVFAEGIEFTLHEIMQHTGKSKYEAKQLVSDPVLYEKRGVRRGMTYVPTEAGIEKSLEKKEEKKKGVSLKALEAALVEFVGASTEQENGLDSSIEKIASQPKVQSTPQSAAYSARKTTKEPKEPKPVLSRKETILQANPELTEYAPGLKPDETKFYLCNSIEQSVPQAKDASYITIHNKRKFLPRTAFKKFGRFVALEGKQVPYYLSVLEKIGNKINFKNKRRNQDDEKIILATICEELKKKPAQVAAAMEDMNMGYFIKKNIAYVLPMDAEKLKIYFAGEKK